MGLLAVWRGILPVQDSWERPQQGTLLPLEEFTVPQEREL